jgi:hypothetical protein
MTDIETDTHHAVGPMEDMYGHGPVTAIQEAAVRDHDTDEGTTLFVCLDCGYVVTDNRLLAHEACDREANSINTTWREKLESAGLGELPVASNEDQFPVE